MARPEVHTESGHRLGAANPYREGPADLRLVGPALGAWGGTAAALNASGKSASWGVVLCLAVAGVLVAPVARRALARWIEDVRARRGALDRERSRQANEAGAAPVDDAATAGVWRYRGAVAGVLVCTAAGVVAGGLHAAEARRGPLPGLAREFAQATVELVVTADPRPTKYPGWGGASVVVEAEVERVFGQGGRAGPVRAAPGGPQRAERGRASGLGRGRGVSSVPGQEPGRTSGLGQEQGPASGLGEGEGGERVRTPVLVFAPAGWRGLLPSTRVRVAARLSPGDGGIAAVLKVPNGPPNIIGPPTAVQRMAGELRAGLRKATEGVTPDARALLPGLVVGDTSRVTPELRAAFEATDLMHLMAVSGSNLAIILALLIGSPGRALLAERGGLAPRLGISLRGTAWLGGVLTLAFVVVCRPEPSVLRAAACGLVTLLAIGTGRRRSLIPALAAAVLLLVLYAPELARSYGFLLSVLATGALLTIAPGWSAALRRRGVPDRLAEVLAAAAAAQAVCAPVVAVFAARISLVAVPCNLLAEPAVAMATIAGFAALAVAPIAMPAAELLAWCASWPTSWIAQVARRGAALPGAESGWPGGWLGGVLLAVATGVAVLGARRLPRHPWLAAVLALLLLLVVLRPAPLTRIVTGWPPPGWAYAMCDVGQGDATVLAAGTGSAVVIDTGPEPGPVDRCLHELGVTRIPLVLLTHFHADHVGGLAGVLRGRSVGVIETTGFAEPPDQAAFVRRTAAADRVPVVVAGYRERRAVGGLSWEVLWPPPASAPAPDGPNDASVTLLVRTAGGLTLLLPGDLEPVSQQGLLRDNPGLARVDVLKVAHHGSAHQDPALLRTVRPRLALISVGRGNRYGHPAPGTVAVLRAQGAVVLRTDTDGAIAVTGAGGALRAVPRGRGP
ncbi:ComEC/Rec2 family competence protein [Streptomyces sp. NPDC006703]|uniref:ComEC/Rec2 family competence protein n=1 Tax=Streptomyces sp. NPDC006703 TaxID=3364759 RepID=UPI0036CE269A